MRRVVLLGALQAAGYHDDTRAFVRLVVENPVRLTVAQKEFAAGARAKQRGVKCSCCTGKGAA